MESGNLSDIQGTAKSLGIDGAVGGSLLVPWRGQVEGVGYEWCTLRIAGGATSSTDCVADLVADEQRKRLEEAVPRGSHSLLATMCRQGRGFQFC